MLTLSKMNSNMSFLMTNILSQTHKKHVIQKGNKKIRLILSSKNICVPLKTSVWTQSNETDQQAFSQIKQCGVQLQNKLQAGALDNFLTSSWPFIPARYRITPPTAGEGRGARRKKAPLWNISGANALLPALTLWRVKQIAPSSCSPACLLGWSHTLPRVPCPKSLRCCVSAQTA